MSVRAKFRCTADKATIASGSLLHEYRFGPVYQPDVPEDERYAKYTPCGELWMNVDNPTVTFEVGAYYYLDFTPVPEED